MKRRTMLGATGFGVVVPLAGRLGVVGRTGRTDAEDGRQDPDGEDVSPLTASGTLKLQNAAERARQVEVRVERVDGDGATTLLEVDSELAPDDAVVAEGLVSSPGRYHVSVATSTRRRDREWTVTADGTPANVLIRLLDDGDLDVTVLTLHR